MSDVTDEIGCTKDSYMGAGAKDTNYNVTAYMIIGTTGKGVNFACRAILEFDVSAIPATATIDSAELHWYCELAAATNNASTLWRCTRTNWLETQVTWNSYLTGSAWTAAGGDLAAADSPETKVAFNLPTTTGWKSVTGLKNMVDYAIANTAGLVEIIGKLDDETASTINAHFSWRNEPFDTEGAPHLVVAWTSPAGQKWIQVFAAKDLGILDAYPDTNYGTDPTIAVGFVAPSTDIYRGLLEFLPSALPVRSRILSGRLQLLSNNTVAAFTIYRLTRNNWVKAQATWNSYLTGSAWTAPGGDYDAAISAAMTPTLGWVSYTITDLVRDAANVRGRILELLIKKDNEGAAAVFSFGSKEHTAYTDPYIVIQYENAPWTQAHVI